MKADTKFISYVPGKYCITQGHKGSERKYKNGQYITPTGCGWGIVSKPPRITVGVNVNGKNTTILVDRYFKDNWGKLTARRVRAIKETLPNELELIENQTYSGDIYYAAADESMASWLASAKKKDKVR